MSNTVINACRKLQIGAAEKAVLMRLADYAHDDGSHIFPAAQTVAGDCCLCRRTVLRCFGRLEELGVLRLDGARGQGRGHTNHYIIDLARVAALIATGVTHRPKGTSQKKGDTASPFPNGGAGPHTTAEQQNHPDQSQIKGDSVAPFTEEKVTLRPIKGDTELPKPLVNSVANATEALSRSPPDSASVVWALKPALMRLTGQTDGAIGGLIRNWLAQYDAALVLQVLEDTLADPPRNPVSWIVGCLKARSAKRGKVIPMPVKDAERARDRERARIFYADHRWHSNWGPKPDEPGCWIAADVLAEFQGHAACG